MARTGAESLNAISFDTLTDRPSGKWRLLDAFYGSRLPRADSPLSDPFRTRLQQAQPKIIGRRCHE